MFADIDECIDDLCDRNAICHNLNGSYECVCKEGYMGNGTLCDGKEQMHTNFHIWWPVRVILTAVKYTIEVEV